MSARKNHITVVVCTYNRAELLPATLASMQQLRTDGEFTYDVLVVDNASTDDTQKVLADVIAASYIEMRSVYEAKPGVAAARNRGLAEATGEWIAFCDDDQEADAAWLLELLRLAAQKQVRIVGGAVKLKLPDGAPQPALAVRRNFGESIGREVHAYTKQVSPGTGNLLLHREVIEEVGNFDENLRQAGEDTDLFRRIRLAGIQSWYNPAAVVWHRIPAYRLTADYQRWSSQRTGWCFADRDRKENGLARTLLVAAARFAQALLIRWPLLGLRQLQGDPQAALGVRCDLWRCEGYVRCAIDAALPAVASQRSFREQIEFRNERSTFSDGSLETTTGEQICLPAAKQAVVETH